MRVDSFNLAKPSFKGYDARKLGGILMNSNYCGIAGEMLEITKKENLPLYILNRNEAGITISKNSVGEQPILKGCWAQDFWTVVKNKLQCFEEFGETEVVKKFFNLNFDKTQQDVRSGTNIEDLQNFLSFMVNLPKCKLGNVEFVYGVNELTQERKLIQKNLIDKDIKEYSGILEKLRRRTHIPGGNFFLVQTEKAKDELLIGEDELKKFSIDKIKKMFEVDKVHVIPQADYHLDMFIRPLDKKRVLVADDELTVSALSEGFDKVCEKMYKIQSSIDSLKYQKVFMALGMGMKQIQKIMSLNPYPKAPEVEKVLNEAGFETIRVPGRIYEIYENHSPGRQKDFFLKQLHNYLNAVVFKNNNDELVYITNNSLFDKGLFITDEIEKKIGFSMKKKFLESIKPYVKEEKVYFVSGENDAIAKEFLPEFQGGIHCMCAEIPTKVKIK